MNTEKRLRMTGTDGAGFNRDYQHRVKSREIPKIPQADQEETQTLGAMIIEPALIPEISIFTPVTSR